MPGAVSGWHHHDRNETSLYVVSGVLRLEFEGYDGYLDAEAGDFVHVPAYTVHRESNPTGETVGGGDRAGRWGHPDGERRRPTASESAPARTSAPTMTSMITALHTLVYAEDAETARAFFRDVLGFPAADTGGGWLIFKTGPSELGVHPSSWEYQGQTGGTDQHFDVSLMCDDLEATMAELPPRVPSSTAR